MAFCLIVVLCLSSTVSEGNDSPDSKSPFDKKPTAKSPFDKKPTAKSPFDKKPTAKSPFDKKPTAKSPLDKKPLKTSPSIKRIKNLETSDGVPLELVYYPPKGKADLRQSFWSMTLMGPKKHYERLAIWPTRKQAAQLQFPDLQRPRRKQK